MKAARCSVVLPLCVVLTFSAGCRSTPRAEQNWQHSRLPARLSEEKLKDIRNWNEMDREKCHSTLVESVFFPGEEIRAERIRLATALVVAAGEIAVEILRASR